MVSSDLICKSARLRELFLYVCHRVLDEGADHINELELGHRVFGRPQFYDTAADNTVRVHASTLRKRLAEYFQGQGRDETLTIEIPRGNYAPLFRVRDPGALATTKALDEDLVAPITLSVIPAAAHDIAARVQKEFERPAAPLPTGDRIGRRLWATALLAFCFAVACVYLLVRPPGGHLQNAPGKALAAGTDVFSLWTQVFPAGGSGKLVMDDSSLDFYQQVTGQSVKLTEYFDRTYLTSVQERASATGVDPQLLHSILLRRQSNFADVNLAGRLTETAAAAGSSAMTVFARDISFREMKADNMVLLGTSQSNPWIQLFESRLAYRWKLDPKSATYYPMDAGDPGAAQTMQLAGSDGRPREGYATVALLPNLGTSGSVLIVSGTGGMAMAAAVDFLMDEKAVHELRARLPKPLTGGFPPFEALLRVDRGMNSPRDVSLVKCRTPLQAGGNATPAAPFGSTPRP